MNSHTEKTQKNQTQPGGNTVAQKQSKGKSAFQFTDNRPEATAQLKHKKMGGNGSSPAQLVDNRPELIAQRKLQNIVTQDVSRPTIQKKQTTIQRVVVGDVNITSASSFEDIVSALNWGRNWGIRASLSNSQKSELIAELSGRDDCEEIVEELEESDDEASSSSNDWSESESDSELDEGAGFEVGGIADVDAVAADAAAVQAQQTRADFVASVNALTFADIVIGDFPLNHVILGNSSTFYTASLAIARRRNIGASTTFLFDATAQATFLAEIKAKCLAVITHGDTLQHQTTADKYRYVTYKPHDGTFVAAKDGYARIRYAATTYPDVHAGQVIGEIFKVHHSDGIV
ncbi:MAG: hypothetical protein COA42_06460 [Alteromonadaceae bacterium]|nr:MAG: hypothetical protein COA42_06460 [Alteromonadaceae bacterium]